MKIFECILTKHPSERVFQWTLTEPRGMLILKSNLKSPPMENQRVFKEGVHPTGGGCNLLLREGGYPVNSSFKTKFENHVKSLF